MSRKKGYKKHLPAVLPPPVRPPIPRQASESAPAPPVPPAVVAPRAALPAETRPASPPAPAPRVPTPTPSPLRGRVLRVAALILVVLLGVGGGAFAIWSMTDDAEGPPASSPPAEVAGQPEAGASRTVTDVRADGTVEVTHEIHTLQPIGRLTLSLPKAVKASGVEATDIEVVADGSSSFGPEALERGRASYLFSSSTEILVRYRLLNAVERSTSAAGRGLVTTTALTVSATQPSDLRIVRSAAVLSLACSRPQEQSLMPCGESEGDGQWRVRLGAEDAGSRVVASVTVAS